VYGRLAVNNKSNMLSKVERRRHSKANRSS
jgi:hypothetical protein